MPKIEIPELGLNLVSYGNLVEETWKAPPPSQATILLNNHMLVVLGEEVLGVMKLL